MVLSMEGWVGKVAIMTGASSEIGVAIVESLVEHGLIVVGLARRVERIQEHSKQLSGKKGKLYGIKTDIRQKKDILEAFKWIGDNLGPVYILINNAGFVQEALLTEGKPEYWKKVLNINVLGREVVRIIKANNIKGHIIDINSISGYFVPNSPKINIYPASKYAITALTKTLRKELNSLQSKVRITSISPGLVVSEMTVLNKSISNERRKFLESRPILKPEDIADGVVYVLSTPEHVQVHELIIKPVGEPY